MLTVARMDGKESMEPNNPLYTYSLRRQLSNHSTPEHAVTDQRIALMDSRGNDEWSTRQPHSHSHLQHSAGERIASGVQYMAVHRLWQIG